MGFVNSIAELHLLNMSWKERHQSALNMLIRCFIKLIYDHSST